jgi:signal recognition particle subunit SRP68
MAGSTKRQIVSRLNKATKYADNLVNVLRDQDITHSNSTDILEARAYLSFLKGALHFEKSQWQACLQEYSMARLVYVTLGSFNKTDVFRDLLSSTIDPSIRYAAYQLKIPRTRPVPHLAVEHFPLEESSTRAEIEALNARAFDVDEESKSTSGVGTSNLPSTLSWRGRTVKLEDAAISQALGLALVREQDLTLKAKRYAEGTTSAEDFAAAYDDIINARQEAVDATKAAISELLTEGVDPSDERMQSLQITKTAVNYAVIEWRVGRNRLLCGPSDGMLFEPVQAKQKRKSKKESKPRTIKDETTGRKMARLRERVALYDAILQSIDAVKELPGVTRETQFVEELAGKRSYFQALRYGQYMLPLLRVADCFQVPSHWSFACHHGRPHRRSSPVCALIRPSRSRQSIKRGVSGTPEARNYVGSAQGSVRIQSRIGFAVSRFG